MKIKVFLLAALLAVPTLAMADGHDAGLDLTAGATYKVNKKISVGADVEMRTRNNFRTFDRWAFSVDASYKLCKYAKLSAGYSLLDDNFREKISYGDAGEVTKWRPSYWGLRHRFNVSVTGSIDVGRFTLSLRERWQYTYRPEKTVKRYDFSDSDWEDKAINGKGKSVLRSRVQVEYDIAKCKVDPYFNAEFFNAWSLEKTRFNLGVDWKITKRHVLDFYYRYQITHNDDDGEKNMHTIGASYKYKF